MNGRHIISGLTAWLISASAIAAPAAPLTLDGLYNMPVSEAAAAALGPGPEAFIERSPWSGIEANYVMNTVSLFGMTFFTRAEKISPYLCMTTMGLALFDTWPNQNPSPEEKMAVEKLPWPKKPLRVVDVRRLQGYFVAGPALPVPLTPDAAAEPVGRAAQVPGNCEHPVSARRAFTAPSQEAAIAATSLLHGVVVSAARRSSLPFELSCSLDGEDCTEPRRLLASLNVQALRAFDETECPDSPELRCTQFTVDNSYAVDRGRGEWTIWIKQSANRKPVEVHMIYGERPIA